MFTSQTPSRDWDVVAALEHRVRVSSSAPLITYYDVSLGERTELSVKTFANWVDKSVNLLSSMDIDEQPRTVNTLLMDHPGHWVALIWTIATWQYGGTICMTTAETTPSARHLDVAVIGPHNPHPVPGIETIACSLHPLGLGFAHRPQGVTDFAEVLSQPDVHWRVPHCGLAINGDREVSWDELNAIEPSADRRLLVASHDAWHMVRDGLVAPILGGGSSVIASGEPDDTYLADLAQQERAELYLCH